MKNIKSHFEYNKNQRSGILLLGILIVILQLMYYFVDFPTTGTQDINTSKILAIQIKIDSLKVREIANRKPKRHPFNPSFITDYKGYKLGMSIQEIDRLHTFRKKGNYINSAKQFQKVTGVSDSLFKKLKPYFKFPDWITNKKRGTSYKSKNNFFKGVKKDINLATKDELQKIIGIGEKLSARILKFKTSIGGYHNIEQLNKVYGLKPKVVTKILEIFYIKKEKTIPVKVELKDLNKATASELKLINGIGDKLATRIIKFRKSINGFYFKDQLNEVFGLNPEVISLLFKQFKIISKPNITKLNINEAKFKEVLHLPYIDYELTKKIFDYRDEFAEIQNIEELKKIEGFPLDKYDRIVLYLKAE